MPEAKLMPVAEACRRLRISPATLYNWVRAGRLDLVRVGGRSRVSARTVRGILSAGDRDRPRSAVERAWTDLVRRGLVDPASRTAFFRPRFSPGAPIAMRGKRLSEIIIEERGER